MASEKQRGYNNLQGPRVSYESIGIKKCFIHHDLNVSCMASCHKFLVLQSLFELDFCLSIIRNPFIFGKEGTFCVIPPETFHQLFKMLHKCHLYMYLRKS